MTEERRVTGQQAPSPRAGGPAVPDAVDIALDIAFTEVPSAWLHSYGPSADGAVDTVDVVLGGLAAVGARYTGGESVIIAYRDQTEATERTELPWTMIEIPIAAATGFADVVDAVSWKRRPECVDPARDALRPFVEVEMVDDRAVDGKEGAPGCEWLPLLNAQHAAWIHRHGSRMHLRLARRADPKDRGSVGRLLAHWEQLVSHGLAQPTLPVRHLEMLSRYERAQILDEWNGRLAPYPDDRQIQTLIEVVAARYPDRVAVEQGTEALTYDELNRRANRWAHYLRVCGVRCGALVGVHMPRCPAMIVAILATLKAGAAYVPVDASYPQERVIDMLEAARPEVVFSHSSVPPAPTSRIGIRIVVDREGAAVESLPDINLAPDGTSTDLAYVIFTSGSTGRPKGIRVEHRGLCSLMTTSPRLFGAGPESRVIQWAPIGFDASVWEIFLPLVVGGTLCLAEATGPYALVHLPRELARRRISIALLSPYVLALVPPRGLPDLRTVVAIGERCTKEHARRWAPVCRFFNAYGPAEATVMVTAVLVPGETDQTDGADPSIGRPWENVRVYLLDDARQLVPVGVTGEIYIGGVYLARDYLGDAALTREKFISNPFAALDGSPRLYKTGDLAYYLPSGDIAFVGRRDQQVKLRGIRLELGEVESLVLEHPGVRSAVALLCRGLRGDILIVYFEPDADTGPAPAAVRATLALRLSEDLLPDRIVSLPQMPLNANGKVDRRALQQMTEDERVRDPQQPRTGVENHAAE